MKHLKQLLFVLVMPGIIFGLAHETYAVGALFVRPLRSNDTHTKMYMKTVDTQVQIQNQIAVTHTDQVFYNEMNQQVEAVFVFPLPEGAVITELVYWFNGHRYVGRIKELQQAIRDYNNKIRRYLDPALLQYLGDNLFRLNIAPINPRTEVRFEITYTELLNYDFGTVYYKYLLNTTSLSPKPLERLSLNIDVWTQAAIKFLRSPSHEKSTATSITKKSDHEYQIVFGDENFHPTKDFELEFETVREGVDINVLTFTPAPADSYGTDSFYALWITPPDTLDDKRVIPKNIVFTADVSSSMEGERLTQLKAALNSFLDHLLPIDCFNIFSFGTHVLSFQPDLVAATPANIEEAREYVRQLSALGLTNINQALLKSLQQSYQKETMNVNIFLTDGYPTWDETDITKILSNVRDANNKNTHIFSFGVGNDVSKTLLERLSQENGGYAQFITADDSIALIIKNHFMRISKPVLADLKIDIPGLLSLDTFPRELPDLFWGNQVLELGRYSNQGNFEVKLTATMRGQTVSFSKNVDFKYVNGGNRFVARLWAKAKIDHLLNEIALYGERKELVDAIIDLSIRYNILTPYTALYADPDDPQDPPTDVDNEPERTVVKNFELAQNYPNPFNPSTEIAYYLPEGRANYHVKLRIYDALGRLVYELVNSEQAPGHYSVIWNGRDLNGEKVASGIYFYVLEVGKVRLMRKMILVQ
jgi:Ca-activated chloride channel family protein